MINYLTLLLSSRDKLSILSFSTCHVFLVETDDIFLSNKFISNFFRLSLLFACQYQVPGNGPSGDAQVNCTKHIDKTIRFRL